jgi:hypothetical protein
MQRREELDQLLAVQLPAEYGLAYCVLSMQMKNVCRDRRMAQVAQKNRCPLSQGNLARRFSGHNPCRAEDTDRITSEGLEMRDRPAGSFALKSKILAIGPRRSKAFHLIVEVPLNKPGAIQFI